MARFVTVTEPSTGRHYHLNLDWIAHFAEDSDGDLTHIAFARGPMNALTVQGKATELIDGIKGKSWGPSS